MRDRQTDARTDLHFGLGEQDRTCERRQDASGHRGCLLDRSCLSEQDGELVAAEARDRIDTAGGVEEEPGGRLQQLIARRVSMTVVDALEPVEVDEEDAGLAGIDLQGLSHLFLKERAVGEPGQRIVECLKRQALVKLMPFGDVDAGGEEEPDAPVVQGTDVTDHARRRRAPFGSSQTLSNWQGGASGSAAAQ